MSKKRFGRFTALFVRKFTPEKENSCLENIEIVRSQVIEYKPTLPFDTLICRAFAPLDRMIIETEHLINNSNQLLAMKGESIDREIKLLQSHNFQTQIIDLSHPDLASQPKLVRIKSLN